MKKILTIIGVGLLMMGCAKKEVKAPENIEQIQKREGVPVKVSTLEKRGFAEYYTFKGKIKGQEESMVYSMIEGKVEKILYDVNDVVTEDQVVITVPTDVPASKYNQVKEGFELSEITYERMVNLYEEGAISKQDLDQAKTSYEVSKSDFDSMTKIVNIESPINGKIGIMYAEVGQEIHQGQPLFKVINTKKYKSRISVPENKISKIEVGQKATAIWNDIVLTGKVSKVSQSLDEITSSFIVDIVFNNNGQNIKTGVSAEIRLDIYDSETIIVDSKYIIDSKDKKYVYVAEDNRAILKEITLGRSFNGANEIKSGISEVDLLITEGSKYVENESLIKIIR
ncbi:MAG: hypothetical protein B6226_00780 [Candidatus Cloacimonetes bacterium 4572_65]|nr:MAG: hypothetical protein B6226_00780 [Candidatus Cloacimonetes bacterium 4572_65]